MVLSAGPPSSLRHQQKGPGLRLPSDQSQGQELLYCFIWKTSFFAATLQERGCPGDTYVGLRHPSGTVPPPAAPSRVHHPCCSFHLCAPCGRGTSGLGCRRWRHMKQVVHPEMHGAAGVATCREAGWAWPWGQPEPATQSISLPSPCPTLLLQLMSPALP